MGYPQCQFHGQTPRILQTWHYYDCCGLCLQESILRSNTHNGHSERSNQTLFLLHSKTPQPSEMCCLWLWTPVRGFIYKGTIQATRYMTILLHSLAPPDGQTNRMHQLRAWLVPPPICQQITEQLVRPPTHRRVPAQQLRLLHDATISIPTGYGTNPPYGLQAKTEPLRPENS